MMQQQNLQHHHFMKRIESAPCTPHPHDAAGQQHADQQVPVDTGAGAYQNLSDFDVERPAFDPAAATSFQMEARRGLDNGNMEFIQLRFLSQTGPS